MRALPEACPYQAIHAAPLNAGREASTPFLERRPRPAALLGSSLRRGVPHGSSGDASRARAAAMGVAVINEDTCLSFQGMRCEVCYRACPLIDEAIRIDYRPREGDAIHAVFAPQVIDEDCAGCGLCEQRCPVSDPAPAIVVVPTGADAAAYTARRNGEGVTIGAATLADAVGGRAAYFRNPGRVRPPNHKGGTMELTRRNFVKTTAVALASAAAAGTMGGCSSLAGTGDDAAATGGDTTKTVGVPLLRLRLRRHRGGQGRQGDLGHGRPGERLEPWPELREGLLLGRRAVRRGSPDHPAHP